MPDFRDNQSAHSSSPFAATDGSNTADRQPYAAYTSQTAPSPSNNAPLSAQQANPAAQAAGSNASANLGAYANPNPSATIMPMYANPPLSSNANMNANMGANMGANMNPNMNPNMSPNMSPNTSAKGNASPIIFQADQKQATAIQGVKQQVQQICGQYLHQFVRIEMLDGSVHEGIIVQFDRTHLYLQTTYRDPRQFFFPYNSVMPLVLYELLVITLLL